MKIFLIILLSLVFNSAAVYAETIPVTNEIDGKLTLFNKDITGFMNSNRILSKGSQGYREGSQTVTGFPGRESDLIWRFQTKTGVCSTNVNDCKGKRANRYTSRNGVLILEDTKRHKIGDSVVFTYDFFIPENFDIGDGLDHWGLSHIHGVGEDVPFSMLLAPAPKKKKYWQKGKSPGVNGSLQKEMINVKKGDLIIQTRSIWQADPNDKSSRVYYKVLDRENLKGKWHTARVEMTYSTQPSKGKFKFFLNNKLKLDCGTCITSPTHGLNLKEKGLPDGASYNYKVGPYRWAHKPGWKDKNPNRKVPELTIYFANVQVEKN